MKDSQHSNDPPVVLRAIDPATVDPDFWNRNHQRIMERAASRLADRRARNESVGDVLMSWSRLLVPSAAMAAGVLGFFLLGHAMDEDHGPLFGVEDVLHEAWVQGSALPVLNLAEPGVDDAFVFAVERLSMERVR